MADNFDFKKYLLENQLGPFAKAKLSEYGKMETGLYVIGRSQIDNAKIGEMVEELGYHAEWDARNGYWFFPELPENYDALESDLQDELYSREIDARFEGVEGEYNPDDHDGMSHDEYEHNLDHDRWLNEANPYSRSISNLGMLEDILENLLRNTATNSNIPTHDKEGLLDAFNEMKEIVLEIGSDLEQEKESGKMSDYMKRRLKDNF